MQAPAKGKPTQGLTLFAGAGGFWANSLEKFNQAVRNDQGAMSGPAAQVEFPLQEAFGLRWEGFVVEYQVLQAELNYTKPVGSTTGPGRATIRTDALSGGYDWAFIRKGTLLGPVELALPLRIEWGGTDAQVGNLNYNTGNGGPAFGLQMRVWAWQRLMLELEGLYHLQPGDNSGGDSSSNCNGGCGGNGGGGGGGGSNNGPSVNLNRDGSRRMESNFILGNLQMELRLPL
jgi:hypothetical protein